MLINFFNYKDGKDFLIKTGMSPEQAIQFLEEEIKRLKGETL